MRRTTIAHLLPADDQEEIQREGQEAEEKVSDQLSPVEMPLPPNGEGDLHHRLGYLEATLRGTLEGQQQRDRILEQQASELARLQRQTEVQEEEIFKKTQQVQEVKREPTFLEKLFGGSHSR